VALPDMNLLADTRFAYANNFDPFVPGRFARWMNNLEKAPTALRDGMLRLMNVSRIIQRDPAQSSGITSTPTAANPRVRWLGCASWVRGEEEAWEAVRQGLAGDTDPNMPLLVLEGSSRPACAPGAAGGAEIVEERPDRIRIAVDAPADGFILLADTWYPGWQVLVDGQPGVDLRANYLFRAAAVAAGKHQVEWVYRPATFTIGVVFSGAALLFMLLLSLLIMFRVK
jgi:hypothetical protein